MKYLIGALALTLAACGSGGGSASGNADTGPAAGGSGGSGGPGGGDGDAQAGGTPADPDDGVTPPPADMGLPPGDMNPACVPGTQSCPCGEGGACNAGLVCDRGFCVPEGDGSMPPPDAGPCTPGARDCGCNAGACDEGLVCLQDRCQVPPPPGEGLTLSEMHARACDALFEEIGGRVAGVTFGDGVIGEFVRRDGRAAVSFVTNASGVADIATVELAGGVAASAETLRFVKATCFDENGQPLEESGLNWD